MPFAPGQIVRLKACEYAKPSPINVTFTKDYGRLAQVYLSVGSVSLSPSWTTHPWIAIATPERPVEFYVRTEDLEEIGQD